MKHFSQYLSCIYVKIIKNYHLQCFLTQAVELMSLDVHKGIIFHRDKTILLQTRQRKMPLTVQVSFVSA